MTTKTVFFKLDLRIDKKMIKLKVYEEDSLNDLIEQLVSAVSWKKISKDKVKNRLEEQLRIIISEQRLSYKVKSKIRQLLQESKFIIMNVDTSSRNDLQLNQTPFKILQQSHNFGKKTSRSHNKHYNYLDNLEPNIKNESALNNNYLQNFDNIRLRSNSQIHIKIDSQIQNLKYEDNQENLIQRKYAALQKKCDDYITKNEQLRNKYKLTQNPTEQIKNFQRQQWKANLYKNQGHQSWKNSDQRIKIQKQPLIECQKRLNRNYQQYNGKKDCQNGQSFHEYKINRYKSYKTIEKKHNFYTISENSRDIIPSRSTHKINLHKENNTMGLLRNYDENSQKLSSHNTFLSRQVRKFNYNII